jgi:hypothetical protein
MISVSRLVKIDVYIKNETVNTAASVNSRMNPLHYACQMQLHGHMHEMRGDGSGNFSSELISRARLNKSLLI